MSASLKLSKVMDPYSGPRGQLLPEKRYPLNYEVVDRRFQYIFIYVFDPYFNVSGFSYKYYIMYIICMICVMSERFCTLLTKKID